LYPRVNGSGKTSVRKEVLSREERRRLSSRLTQINGELGRVGIGSARTKTLKDERSSILVRLGGEVEREALVAA